MAPTIVFWPWTSAEPSAATLRSARESAAPTAAVIVADARDGFAKAMNDAARTTGRADLAILADAGELPGGWLERMEQAACVDDTVAAATALATGPGTPLFAGFDDDPVLRELPADSGGQRSRAPVHPRIPTLWPWCTYIRRSALDLLGPFEESLRHPAAVLAEFAARALSRALACVLADDVLLRRLTGGLAPCPEAETAKVAAIHPWLTDVQTDENALELGPLRRSLLAARVSGRRLSVTVDARALGPMTAGTQSYTAGLVLALARSGRATVRALVGEAVSRELIDELEHAGIEIVLERDAVDRLPRTDVAHRPEQVFVPEDLSLLRKLGERVVITQQDLIAYRDPTYHASHEVWRQYRRVTRLALGAADSVVFLSEHSRRDAIAEDLIEPAWTAVVGAGVERVGANLGVRRPERVPSGRDLLIVIGTDYLHKNRLFALELAEQLSNRHGWEGLLVLAGRHVADGGSAAAEAAWLRERPKLAAQVIDLGPVTEAEKHWLLQNAQAVLCPSLHEGFGLVPLEAAASGVPCLYAAVTSLAEVIGPDAETLVAWDAAASADRVLPLLEPGEARDRHLAALSDALGRRAWAPIAEELIGLYEDVIGSPYRSSVPRAWEELERERLIVELDTAHRDLWDRVEHGLPLIDRDGFLSPEQQRGLMRVAARRWLRAPLLGPLGRLGGAQPEHRRGRAPAEHRREDAHDHHRGAQG
jgi:glycosyltransferase involved in cell wall biosynthesis